MKYKYDFTVFTPTFNRVHLLPKVYDSLKKQTFQDFEWLIVDDGSTDNTFELVDYWQQEAAFPIRYYWQQNAGKHVARNFGVSQAQGELFFTLDSDDEIVPHSLERFRYHWVNIAPDQRERFAGVAGLCMRPDGSIIGTKFPRNKFDSNMFEIRNKYRVRGEKCGFQRTDVMKQFPFPVFEGERFLTEAVVWNRIAQNYKTRFVNEIFRKYEVLSDGLSVSYLKLRIKSPKGFALYFNEYLSMPVSLRGKLKSGVNYVRCSLLGEKRMIKIIKEAKVPLFAIVGIPLGWILYLKDRRSYFQTKS